MKQKHIENIFTHLGDAVIMVNENSVIIYGNDAFFSTFGYKTNQVIGKNLDFLIDLEDSIANHHELVKRFLYSDNPPIASMSRKPILCRDSEGNKSPFNISLSKIESGKNVIGVAILHDVTGIEDEREEYELLARTDKLTGLHNRHHFEELLESKKEWLGADQRLGIIYIDLNKFKSINDEYGHASGDDILKIISQRISNSIRSTDIACRIGGDEFVIFALNVESQEDLNHLTDSLNKTISQASRSSSLPFKLEAAIGACLYPDDGTDIKKLVELADKKMYVAKRANQDSHT